MPLWVLKPGREKVWGGRRSRVRSREEMEEGEGVRKEEGEGEEEGRAVIWYAPI